MGDTSEITNGCLTHYDSRHIQVRADFMGLCQYNRDEYQEKRKKQPNQECMAKILRLLETLTDHAKTEWTLKTMRAEEKGLVKPKEPTCYPIKLSNEAVVNLMYKTFGESTVRNSLNYLIEIGYIATNQEKANAIPTIWLEQEYVQSLLKLQAQVILAGYEFRPPSYQGAKSYPGDALSNPSPVISNPDPPILDPSGCESTDNNISNKKDKNFKDNDKQEDSSLSPHVESDTPTANVTQIEKWKEDTDKRKAVSLRVATHDYRKDVAEQPTIRLTIGGLHGSNNDRNNPVWSNHTLEHRDHSGADLWDSSSQGAAGDTHRVARSTHESRPGEDQGDRQQIGGYHDSLSTADRHPVAHSIHPDGDSYYPHSSSDPLRDVEEASIEPVPPVNVSFPSPPPVSSSPQAAVAHVATAPSEQRGASPPHKTRLKKTVIVKPPPFLLTEQQQAFWSLWCAVWFNQDIPPLMTETAYRHITELAPFITTAEDLDSLIDYTRKDLAASVGIKRKAVQLGNCVNCYSGWKQAHYEATSFKVVANGDFSSERDEDYSDFDVFKGNGKEERAALEREYFKRLDNGTLAM